MPPPLAVSPPRITSPAPRPANKLSSKLAANTLIVHYDTVDDLISRVEGPAFHTVIVHVQGVMAKAAGNLALSLSSRRPKWHICMYNPAAELLMFEIPSHSHEMLHTDLHARFLAKLRNRDIAAQFDVDVISGTLCTSLTRDYSLAQPDSAVRPKCRLDESAPNVTIAAVDVEDDVEEEVEVPDEPPAAEPVATAVAPESMPTAAAQVTKTPSEHTPPAPNTDAATTAVPEAPKADAPAPDKKLKKKKKKKLTEAEKAKRKEDRRQREEMKRKFPSFVVEAGWAQSVLMLQNKARWWLKASDGQVRTVLIAKAVQATGVIVIEKWSAATGCCEQYIEIRSLDGSCPLKRKKILPIQLDEVHDVVDDDEHMLEADEDWPPITPDQFQVLGEPIHISFNDVFLAEPGAEPRPEYDICLDEEDLREYACRVWNTAAAEDAERLTSTA